MATKEGENMCFVLFCYFWLRFTKCVIPAKFQIPVPHNKEVRPFFTKSMDFKHVSMATKEGENMCFVLICYFWLRFTKYVIPAKFQIPVPQNNRVRPFFSVDFKQFPWQRKRVKIYVLCILLFLVRLYKCIIPAKFQIPFLDPFFTKSVDFKHVSMATKESGNTSFALFCYFWLRFTKCVIPAKFQIPVPHNKEVRPFFTKSMDFKHVSMATKEGENMCFVLICYFWLRFTKYVIPAKFQIPVPQNNRVRPFFTKSVDFKHVSMATKESENMCFVYFAIFG